MKKIVGVGCALTLLLGLSASFADTPPEMPKPGKEHEWLGQLVGEWTTEGECLMEEGKATKTTGTETSRMVGGFWATFEHQGEMAGEAFTGILTLGWDPEKKHYVGTWVDSMTPMMWQYTGTVDATGKVLTLETTGPCPTTGKPCRFREVIEITGPDSKTFTSNIEMDGKWVTMMKMTCTRKK